MRTYKLVHITDLAQLSDADVSAFAAELPTVVAALRLAARKAGDEPLSSLLPHITYAPEIGDNVVMRTSEGVRTVAGQDMREAERTDGAAHDAIQRARRRP